MAKDVRLAENQDADTVYRQLSEYRQLFDSTADPAVIIDYDGIILDCNQTLLDVYGYEINQLLGEHIIILHDENEDIRDIQENFNRAEGKTVPHEYQHKTKNGLSFPVEVSTSKINFNARPAKLSTIRDITRQKKAIDALHESEKKFRLAFDASIIGKALSSIDGPFFQVNQTLCNILEYPSEELIGMFALSITHPDDIARSRQAIQKMIAGELENDGFTLEKRYISKSGRIVWSNTMVSLLRDDQNRPLYTIVEIVDITEQKNVEETNRQLRNYLSNIINSMPSILVGATPEGRITQWNQKAQVETHKAQDQVLGQQLSDHFPHFKRHLDQIPAAIEKRETIKASKIPRISDEKTIYEDLTIYPLIANDVEGVVIRIDDVTEQVRLEDMMLQSEKMMSIGGLAAGMAHEINNPLAGIMQNSQVLLSRLTQSMPANLNTAENLGISFETIKSFMAERKIISLLEMIHASGARAAKIVQNMLSFARKSSSEKTHCNLVQIMENSLELANSDYDIKHNYDFKKISINKFYDPGLPPVFCEAGKIQQVFLNLLKNAAQALHEKTYRDDETPQIDIKIFQKNFHLQIHFQDNGPGIDKKNQNRIFEPFFTTKGPKKGTGLGLSVSYFIIVEDHHGKMNVISSPGGGTTFIMELPVDIGT